MKPPLDILYTLLIEANKTTNLTRITSAEEFETRHIVDTHTLLPWLNSGMKIIDIGSGAGFPALPLAVALPDSQIVAVESVGKKVRFIEQAIQALALTNITAIAERSETLAHDRRYRGQFDVATARAVASLNILAELCLPFVKPGGLFLAMKTQSAMETELPAAENAIKLLGGKVRAVKPTLENRVIVVIEKVGPTPVQYPRQAGIPNKKPL